MKHLKIHITWLVIVLLITGTSVAASNKWIVTKYEGKIFWNGSELHNDPSRPFIQKDGLTYIPVRSFDTHIGFTRYDAIDQSIFIDTFASGAGGSSNVFSEKEDSLFHLRINSSKEQYKVGEDLQIWSVLNSKNDNTVPIQYGGLLLNYVIEDEQGSVFKQIQTTDLKTKEIKPNTQELLGWNNTAAYNYNRGSSKRYDQNGGEALFNKEITRPLRLPAGKYTIKVTMEYKVLEDINNRSYSPDDYERLATSIPITIVDNF